MLTLSTQIPTAARGKVRALVKSHHAWADYLRSLTEAPRSGAKVLIGTGRLSSQIKNAELIAFALCHKDLTAKLETLLGLAAQKPWLARGSAIEREQERRRIALELEQRNIARLKRLLAIAECHFAGV